MTPVSTGGASADPQAPSSGVTRLTALDTIYLHADGLFMQPGFGAAWVASPSAGLIRVSPGGDTYQASESDTVIDVGIGSKVVVALTSGATSQLIEVDPTTYKTLRTVSLATGAKSLAVSGQTAYVDVGTHPATVDRIDLQTGAIRSVVLAGITGSLAGGQALAIGDGLVWATDGTTILGLDPVDLSVRRKGTVSPAVGNIWFGDGSLWAADEMHGSGVHRVDPQTVRETAEVASDAVQIAFSPHGVWVSATSGPAELDPTTAAVIGRLPDGDVVADDSSGIAVMGDEVWVAYKGDGVIQRIKIP